jgi:hypothetical protein
MQQNDQAPTLLLEDCDSTWSARCSGRQHREYVEPDVFAQYGFPGAEELAEMFKWFTQYGYYGPETEERKHASGTDASGGKLLSFKEWLDTEAYKKFLDE